MRLLGLDIGTTSICGILCDAETGEILQTVTKPNAGWITAENEWEKLQDPGVLLGTVREIAEELAADGDVAAIGLTGQMHGIVYLDGEGNPVSPLIIWQDGRGDLPFREGKTYAETASALTGYRLATGFGAVTHFTQTVRGQIPPRAVSFCTIHDLAAMELTGRKTPLLHPSDAASFGLYDLKKNAFDTAAIRAAGMDPAFFPAVAAGFAPVGFTKKNIPVSVAIGDNQASVLGSVSSLTDSVLVNIGTGSQISCVTTVPPEQTAVECRPLIEGHWLLVGSALCGGRAYAILEQFLRETAALITGQDVKSAYAAMDQMMRRFVPSGEPLIVDPRFCGTRQDPKKRGSIGNIGIHNFSAAALCDGVMNGMVEELMDFYTEMRPFLPQKMKRLIGSGNGLRLNQPLAERFSRAFGLPLSVPKVKEEAAFGAALFAAVAAGVFPDMASAQTLIRYEGEK